MPKTLSRYRTVARFSSTVAGGIGAAALAGWLTGTRTLASGGGNFIPMAPNTALAFIFLATSLLLFLETGKTYRRIILACNGIVVTVALIRLCEILFGVEFNTDHWIFQFTEEMIGLAPVGRMAFFTAVGFLLGGTSLLLLVFSAKNHSTIAACILASVVAFIGIAFSLGYLYGAPLLYGTVHIPMALNTAIAFWFSGMGIVSVGFERLATHRRKDEQYRLLFETNPLPMWVYDLQTLSFLAVNDAAVNHYGYSREEFLKMTIKDIRPPEEIPRLLANISNDVGDFSQSATWRHRKKDGTIIDVEITSHAITFEGHTARLVAVNDVSERKRTEEALRVSERQLSLVYDNVADIIFYLGVESGDQYRFLSINPAFLKATGLADTQVVGKLVSDVIPDPSLSLVLRKYKEAIAHKTTVRWEETTVYPSGTKHGEVSVTPVFDEFGRCTNLIGTVHDVTERKQSEEALRASEQRYRTTLDSMLEGCQIIGFDWRYLYLNDVAARQGRRKKEELLGRTMMEAYPGIEQTAMYAKLRECMEQRVHHQMENEFQFPDGSKGWFYLSMEPVPEGVFILSTDITNEKLMNEELKKHRDHLEELVRERTAQLEAANKELEAFSYSVSHDLRAPLRHIDGFADLLLKRAAQSLDDKSKRFLNTISESAKHMGILIDELLVFSRMGRAEMRATKVDLEPFVKEIFAGFAQEMAGRAIRVNIDRLPVVEADMSMLRLVFQNLIGNALKYTRTRKTAEIHVGSTKMNNEQVIFVRDNGVGFDMQYVDKLFGVFQRLHSSNEFEGTGIGLANVRRIIHRHGGKTWAEGKVDGGATFYFSLPNHSGG